MPYTPERMSEMLKTLVTPSIQTGLFGGKGENEHVNWDRLIESSIAPGKSGYHMDTLDGYYGHLQDLALDYPFFSPAFHLPTPILFSL